MKSDADQTRSNLEESSGDGALLDSWTPEIAPTKSAAEPSEHSGTKRIRSDSVEFSALELEDRVVISLLFNQHVRIEQIERAWRRMRKLERRGERPHLWRVLSDEPGLERERVFEEAAKVYKFKTTEIGMEDALNCLHEARTVFSPEQWSRMQAVHLLPVRVENSPEKWTFITYDPLCHELQILLKSFRLSHTELEYAPEHFTTELITKGDLLRNEYFERVQDADSVLECESEVDSTFDEDSLEAEISRSALVNLFEAALVEAVHKGASDLHIFPNEDGHICIHLRINGELETWYVEEHARPESLIAIIKDRTFNLDRFEREIGQDGSIQRTIDDTLIRFRVSVLPLTQTDSRQKLESIVIRVLDDRKVIPDLESLKLPDEHLKIFRNAIRQPTGLILLTGPTGSGKTTTLYAALQEITSPRRNVLTAEDPVEYIIPGVRQLRISHKLGVGEALRFILRHDPDVVMVGEIRDSLTAELAIQVANTGHLTFSTLHTNDAPSAATRLYMMGIEPFLVAHSINLIVAQRLINVLCSKCKEESDEDPDILKRLGFSNDETSGVRFQRAGSDPHCSKCEGTGYCGRRAITEMMRFTEGIKRIIAMTDRFLDEDSIRRQASEDGMRTLFDAAKAAVLTGETSVLEMMRAVGTKTL